MSARCAMLEEARAYDQNYLADDAPFAAIVFAFHALRPADARRPPSSRRFSGLVFAAE